MSEHLPLIVGGSPGVEIPVADGRLERRREPWLERLGRLDIVVAVDQERRLARGTQPFGVDDRMPLRRDQLGFQPHGRQVVANEGRRSLRILVVIRLGADAGNPDQVLELLLEVAPMCLEVRVHPLQRHARPPFRVRTTCKLLPTAPSLRLDEVSRASPANPAYGTRSPQYSMVPSPGRLSKTEPPRKPGPGAGNLGRGMPPLSVTGRGSLTATQVRKSTHVVFQSVAL